MTSAENYKALDLFEIAAKGISHEPFLKKLIKDETGNQAYVAYYLKVTEAAFLFHSSSVSNLWQVIQLFELHKSRDCAIQIANTALSIIDPDNPRVATLYSVQFKHHLALRHYEESFYALKANPDHDRKKDNLRDLVKTLLDERNFDMLLNFTYGGKSFTTFVVQVINLRPLQTWTSYSPTSYCPELGPLMQPIIYFTTSYTLTRLKEDRCARGWVSG